VTPKGDKRRKTAKKGVFCRKFMVKNNFFEKKKNFLTFLKF
jgi:hypothetical protein